MTEGETALEQNAPLPEEELPAEGLSEEPAAAGESEAGISGSEGEEEAPEAVDYEKLAADDLAELQSEFPELEGLSNLAELNAPLRYAELRDLGLSPREAYLATSSQTARRTSLPDNRRHLSPSVPRHAASRSDGMNLGEMNAARELFSGLSDGEIRSLYRRVTAEHR